MPSINFDLDLWQAGLSLAAGIRRIVRSIKLSHSHNAKSRLVTVERAVQDFFGGMTGPGFLVTVEGYISRYVLTHRPRFHSLFSHRVTEHSITPDPLNPFQGKVSFSLGSTPNQFPIQAIPPVMAADANVYVYFLYPPDIKSFLLPTDPDKSKRKEQGATVENLLTIGRENKPIIVLSPTKLAQQAGRIVKLSGVAKEVDEEVVATFLQTMTASQREILANSIRPFAESRLSFCLDLRDHSKIDILDSSTHMPGRLYLESHLEDVLRIPNYQKLMGASLPGALPGLHWWSHQGEGVSWGLAASDVHVASVEFSRFAFFVDTDLSQPMSFEADLKKLHSFCEVFRKGVQNHARKNYGVELKHKYDFLFDYERAKLFHPEGVLVSREVEEILKQEPENRPDIDWLREASNRH